MWALHTMGTVNRPLQPIMFTSLQIYVLMFFMRLFMAGWAQYNKMSWIVAVKYITGNVDGMEL